MKSLFFVLIFVFLATVIGYAESSPTGFEIDSSIYRSEIESTDIMILVPTSPNSEDNSYFEVTTGYGYFLSPDGKVHSGNKAILPKGRHKMTGDYTYVEVNNQSELDSIPIYIEPPTAEELARQKQEQLDTLDRQSIRALRALLAKSCEANDADCQTLKTKETQAKALRNQ
jgi:hypothetical protein